MGALLDPLQYFILPVFGFPIIGYLMGARGVFSRPAAEGANAYVVGIAVPCLIFRLVATADLGDIDWPVVLAYQAILFTIYGWGYLLARHLFRLGRTEALLVGMTGAFPNHVFLILPIVSVLYGPQSVHPVATMIALDTMLIFAGTIMMLEAMTGGAGPVRTLTSILSNRLIVAIFGGLAVNLAGVELHAGLLRFLDLAAASAAPVSLFSLGVILSANGFLRVDGPAWMAVAFKLFMSPLLGLTLIGAIVPVSPLWADPTRLVFAAPCGAMAFVLALKYGVRVDSIARAIIISTVLSIGVIALLA